ncbi:GTP cyclohydrolase II [Kineococcus indalonis]|uniref:hypothetical protein n=1 Tax=Kineococcus indalonis TaxID=2696566 RepID=UPI002B1BE5BD|nr:hypothetical protein [Kineococcus indalonis]
MTSTDDRPRPDPGPAAPAAVRTSVDVPLRLALGVHRVRLLSNDPDEAAQLARHGITVTERVPTGVHLTAANARSLAAERDRTAHTLRLGAPPG